jgi:hypothetical protein
LSRASREEIKDTVSMKCCIIIVEYKQEVAHEIVSGAKQLSPRSEKG